MNACTETAPDIRVAGPLRDFLVRAFAPFRVTGATGRRNAGRMGAVRMDTVVLHARGEGPFVSRAPTVNPVPVSVHAVLPAQRKNMVHISEISRRTAPYFVTNLSLSQDKCLVISYQKDRQKRINRDIIFSTQNLYYIQKNI